MRKTDAGITIQGKRWIAAVTRNMSFWHGWLDDCGNLTPDAWLDRDIHADGMRFTLNGIETTVFKTNPNFQDYSKAVLESVNSAKKISALKNKYEAIANELMIALHDCSANTNATTFNNLILIYKKYTPGLFITSIIGRQGHELLKAELTKSGIAQIRQDGLINAITYPEEHTPAYNSSMGVLAICKSMMDGTDSANINKMKHDWIKLYHHIPSNFCGEPWTMADLNQMIKNHENIDPNSEIARNKRNHEEKLALKYRLLEEIANPKVTLLSDAIAVATYLNEYRKGIFSKVSLGLRPILAKIAQKAHSKNWRDTYYLTPQESQDILAGKKYHLKKVAAYRRIVATISIYDKRKNVQETELLSKTDINSIHKYVSRLHGKEDEDGKVKDTTQSTDLLGEKIIKGLAANAGKAKGIARLVFGKKDFPRFKQGDVLIAPMTSVDYISLMEKASAFVTNEGGITSHASIVSREMNKPCVIGTYNATSIIKDGDIVEVDGTKGIVKIFR